jgi:hypothetical protein
MFSVFAAPTGPAGAADGVVTAACVRGLALAPWAGGLAPIMGIAAGDPSEPGEFAGPGDPPVGGMKVALLGGHMGGQHAEITPAEAAERRKARRLSQECFIKRLMQIVSLRSKSCNKPLRNVYMKGDC